MKAISYLMDRMLTKDLILKAMEHVTPNGKRGRTGGEAAGGGGGARTLGKTGNSDTQEKASWTTC